MKSLLLKALNVEPGESTQVTYLLLQGFFMGIFLASYDVAATTLFISDHTKAELETQLPLAILAGGGIGIIATYLYSFLQVRMSFKVMAMFWIALMIFLVFSAWTGMEPDGDNTNTIFVVFVLAIPFNFIALLIFWGAFGRLFNLRQAKRIIGGIDTGQLIASIVALFSIGLLVDNLNHTEDLLLLSGAAAGGLLVVFFFLSSKYKLVVQTKGKQRRISFVKMFKNKYITLMGLFVVVSMIAVYFVDYSFLNVTSAQFPDEKALGSFIAYFEATVVIFSFLFQTFVTDWIISNYGLKIALIINPVLIGILTTVAIVVGTSVGFVAESDGFIYFFLIIAGGKLFIDSLKDALDGPSFKLYFLPIESNVKFDVQTKIEGVITAFAGVLAGGLIILINNFNLPLIAISLALVPMVGLWYVITNRMHNNYKETLQETLDKTKKETDEEDIKSHSIGTVLEHEIQSSKEERVIYSLKLMEKLEPSLFENSLLGLMENSSDKVKTFVTDKVRSLDLEYENLDDDSDNSDIKKLAKQAKGQMESTEVLSIPSTRLHTLATSIKKDDRLLAAKLLRKIMEDENIFILLDLLRDQDPRVRMAAVTTARKTKRQETWPILIELLDSSTYGHAAAAALVEAGEECLFTLETAFHKSGQTQQIMLKIVQIMGKIGGAESFTYLWNKVDFPDRKIVKQILNSFRYYDYQANEEETGVINTLLDAEIGKAIWNMAAIQELPTDENNAMLISALEEEIDSNMDHLYMLLSLMYDPKSVQLVKENIETGTTEGIALGIELLDIFIHQDLKPKLFPLLDDIPVANKVRQLQIFFPRENYNHVQVLNYIINRDYNQVNRWTKALTIKSIESIEDFKISKGLIAQLFNPDVLLMETAAWIIYQKDKRTYQKVSQRLKEDVKRSLDEKLFSTFFFDSVKDDFPLNLDKILFLKEIDVFRNISGILLSQIVDNFKTIKLKEGSVDLYDEDDNKPIFIVAKGEATLYHDDEPVRTMKEKDVFGEIFSLDSEKSITSLSVKNETIIFQISLNDFFNVMANQHELAQSFINSVSNNLLVKA